MAGDALINRSDILLGFHLFAPLGVASSNLVLSMSSRSVCNTADMP